MKIDDYLAAMNHVELEYRRLGHLNVAVATREQALAHIVQRFEEGREVDVAFANTNLVTQAARKPSVAEDLKRFFILNDGIGLTIASKLVHGAGFLDNLNGTDFTPALLQALPAGTRVFLYGSKPHVSERASRVLEQTCNVEIVGMQDGFSAITATELCSRMNAAKAQVVLVALGNPRQEEWIAMNRHLIKAPVCVSVGAFLDFTAGEFTRAPAWVQKIHMEWFYRLMNEPRRLAKRYTIDIVSFLIICLRHSRSVAPVILLSLATMLVGACSMVTSEPPAGNGLVGVNLSGAEYAAGNVNARLNTNYVYPTESDMRYFASKGMAIIRLPFNWERVQPKLFGPLDKSELRLIRNALDKAYANNLKVVLDVHNFGAYRGINIGKPGVDVAALADFWDKMSFEFKGSPAIWGYGLMNEPVKIDKGVWPKAAQLSILKIREHDKVTPILVPGEFWSSAMRWKEVNPEFPLQDPADNLIYEAHTYFDKDSSGTYKDKSFVPGAEIADTRLMPFLEWLEEHKVRGFIGEYGVPSDPEWHPVLARALELMHEHNVPSTYWAAGRWWGSYPLSVQPDKLYEDDKPQMKLLEDYARKPLAASGAR